MRKTTWSGRAAFESRALDLQVLSSESVLDTLFEVFAASAPDFKSIQRSECSSSYKGIIQTTMPSCKIPDGGDKVTWSFRLMNRDVMQAFFIRRCPDDPYGTCTCVEGKVCVCVCAGRTSEPQPPKNCSVAIPSA